MENDKRLSCIYKGIEVKLPRTTIKEGFANNIISNGHVWIDMLEKRNLVAYVYD